MTHWTNNLSIENFAIRTEQSLERFLSHMPLAPTRLQKAMQYAVFNGGKRLRPLLVYTVGTLLDVPLPLLDTMACAIEFIHCYSLVHDDLPAMDDADFRRGKPSCHKAFDEATAILVGDALQLCAFEIIAEIPDDLLSAKQALHIITTLTRDCGAAGMVGGQMLDLETNAIHTEESLKYLHELKTGKLLQACFEIPLICSHLRDTDIGVALMDAANNLGLAFQVQDDLLDFTGNLHELGKPQGQDQKSNKPTFATIMPIATADQLVNTLYETALMNIHGLKRNDADLCALITALASRRH